MEQHPIPQNVSSYQFKLVGDMTLKQFFQLAGGILVGIILWNLPLLFIIRAPLAGMSILLGIGLAFLPFEERPLEKWIFAFFRAIYSPTVFTWQKGSFSARVFQEETNPVNMAPTDAILKDYLAKGHETSAFNNLEKAEGNFFARIASLIKGSSTPQQINTPTKASEQTIVSIPENKPTPQIAPTLNSQTFTIPLARGQDSLVRPSTQQADSTYVPTNAPQPTNINVPVSMPTTIPHTPKPILIEQIVKPANTSVAASVQPTIMGNEMISTKQALFSIEAAPPSPPTNPNVVVGQVVDQDRRIVEGAIMEIRDSAGRPIRALRSNKAGHFITVTQLDNGKYEIITEKEGYEFSPVSFDAEGNLIPPILVQGKRLSEELAMPAVPVKPLYSIN